MSLVASYTTITPLVRMVWAQNDSWRGVSETARPTRAFSHCRFRSIRVTVAIGLRQMNPARRAISSKFFSAPESSP